MTFDFPFTIPALRAAYTDGLSPVRIVAEIHRRLIALDDPAIFIHLCPQEELMAQAEALIAEGFDPVAKPLWGIPFAVKDNIDVAGLPTTAACPAFAYTPPEDAFVVARLKRAGALMLGKTNLDQFATGLVGVRSPYGVPKNALDPEIIPGGSSSGSAVLVGHGLAAFTLGTDTAGSGRVPAALNNIVGLKPSLGALSARGVVPACRTLDTISVFAQTVDDAYRVFEIATAYDPEDAYAKPIRPQPLMDPPRGLTLGIPDAESLEFFGDHHQADSFQAAADRLEQAGLTCTPMDFTPFYAVAELLYDGAWVAERFTVIEAMMRDRPEEIHPVTRRIIGAARDLAAADAFRGLYRLQELKRAVQGAMDGIDLLCVPSMPTFYRLADLEADPVTPNTRLGTYTNFVNLLDLCGLAVPTEARADGRPGSVTLLARSGQDGLCASVGRVFEAGTRRRLGATPFVVPPPNPIQVSAATEDLWLAVCGAHMRGLPLNGQLTERGGQFIRTATTAPEYRFYALAGGPPDRPGLVRVGSGHGEAIHLEIWSLPNAEVGGFLAGIPAPLGLGTVVLSDGSEVKGFICEGIGAHGATDISSIGNWRDYVARAG